MKESRHDWLALHPSNRAAPAGVERLHDFAWYGHLKNLADRPWWIGALVSWGIALFEYLLQVPGNRIGFTVLSVAQLKILQEAITLTVFVPFAIFYLKEPPKLDYLWAGLCILGAVFFIFRSKLMGE